MTPFLGRRTQRWTGERRGRARPQRGPGEHSGQTELFSSALCKRHPNVKHEQEAPPRPRSPGTRLRESWGRGSSAAPESSGVRLSSLQVSRPGGREHRTPARHFPRSQVQGQSHSSGQARVGGVRHCPPHGSDGGDTHKVAAAGSRTLLFRV